MRVEWSLTRCSEINCQGGNTVHNVIIGSFRVLDVEIQQVQHISNNDPKSYTKLRSQDSTDFWKAILTGSTSGNFPLLIVVSWS